MSAGLWPELPWTEWKPTPDTRARWENRRSPLPVAERFRYLYDADELGERVPRIRQAAGQVKNLHLLMNNCYANYGATNAREVAAMLETS